MKKINSYLKSYVKNIDGNLLGIGITEENILNLQEAKRNLADQIVTGGGISYGELTKADILKMIEESRP